MKNTLATLALAAIPALVLSACNGGTAGSGAGVSAIPNTPASHSRIRHDDNGPQDLHAGGSTFAAYAYNLGSQPVGSYTDPQPPPGTGSLFANYGGTGTIYYCLTGSGFGRAAFESNNGTTTDPCAPLGASPTGLGGRQDPPDFAGSDAAMASTECCTSGTTYYKGRLTGSVTWGQPFEIPVFGGPIAYGFRPGDFKAVNKQIQLSTWTYCAIANGTIGNWNDGAITADNGKSVTGGKSEPITFYYRSDKSGTTFVLTTDYNSLCNGSFGAPYNAPPYGSPSRSAAWTFGINQLWPGPNGMQASGSNFIGESGNPGVLAAIQSTPYATGYVEGAWAASASPKVGQALLQNGGAGGTAIFVSPTNRSAVAGALKKITASHIQYGGGADGNPLGSSTPWCQLYLPPNLYDNPPSGTYPIVGPTYLDFYGNNNGIHVADKTTLIKYLVSSAATTYLKSIEYAPFNASMHSAVLKALNGTTHHHPCLQ